MLRSYSMELMGALPILVPSYARAFPNSACKCCPSAYSGWDNNHPPTLGSGRGMDRLCQKGLVEGIAILMGTCLPGGDGQACLWRLVRPEGGMQRACRKGLGGGFAILMGGLSGQGGGAGWTGLVGRLVTTLDYHPIQSSPQKPTQKRVEYTNASDDDNAII